MLAYHQQVKPRQVVYTRPPLYARQEAAIFTDYRIACIEASTKSGKTHGALAWLFEMILFAKYGAIGWWVAPVYQQSAIAFHRLLRALEGSELLVAVDRSDMIITLPGDRKIFFKSGERPDNLYGEDVDAAVIDEASRLREDSFIAVRSTLTATRGPLVLIGNVRGRRNWFYKLCRRIERGNLTNATYHKLTAIDAARAGVLDRDEIKEAKELLPPEAYKELYLAEAAEEAANPFGMNNIEQCTLTRLSKLPPVCYGIDLAKSSDWSVIIGLDKYGQVCHFDRFQKHWTETVEFIIELPNHPMMIDNTGVGNAPTEYIQKARAVGTVYEFTFTKATKQPLVELLGLSLAERSVFFPAGIIKDELGDYEYEYTRTGILYSAPAGFNDDTVIALALANKLRRELNGMPGIFIGRV